MFWNLANEIASFAISRVTAAFSDPEPDTVIRPEPASAIVAT